MRAREFITERKKRKRKPRWAAYGPGPYGGYGYAVGYSGDSGVDGGGVGEASDFDFATAYIDDLEKKFLELNSVFVLVDRRTGRKLNMFDPFEKIDQAKNVQKEYGLENNTKIVKRTFKNRSKYNSSDVDEGWKDVVAAGALATGVAFGSPTDASAKTQSIEKPSITQQVSKKELSKTVTGNPHEVVLKKAAERAGIKGQELIAFLSQAAHETLDFKHMKEIGGSLDFRKYDPKYAPKKAKALGNKAVGDGAKYKGRGYIQLTGRYNYKKAGEALGLPLEAQPELVEKPEVAAKVAVWYWQNRVAPKVDSFKDTKAVTKTINPGLKHLDQRKDKQQAFQVAMK
jgi:predicted chitinase